MSLFDSVPPPVPEPALTPAAARGSAAVISPCGLYRYRLERWWGNQADQGFARQIGWVMLNPSTADATLDDPTIRRCIGFSMAWGFPGMVVCNLFGLRSPSPSDLARAADPIGPENDAHLLRLARECHQLVLAWGAHGESFGGRGDAVVDAMLIANSRLTVLGWTSNRQPVHPLYQPKTLRPAPWADRPPPRPKRASARAPGARPC